MSWKGLLVSIFLCLGLFSACLYSYLDMQNVLTSLRIQIPELASQVRRIQEENGQLRYQIESRESPARLMEIARQNEFAHLKYPHTDEVLTLQSAAPFPEKTHIAPTESRIKSKLAFVRK